MHSQPTRKKYLLDLILTDIDGQVKSEVLPKIADHLCTTARFLLHITCGEEAQREVWQFGAANWRALRRLCREHNWDYLNDGCPSEGAIRFQNQLLCFMRLCIPRMQITKVVGSHPWVNGRCTSLVSKKIAVEGTEHYSSVSKECSEGFFEEYLKYVPKTQKV